MLVSGDDDGEWRALCDLQGGPAQPGSGDHDFDDDEGLTVVIRHVPAIGVCDSCGEAYFDEETARAVLEQVPERQVAASSSSSTLPEPVGC